MAMSYLEFKGRIRRRDYFVGMFKLSVVFLLAINILSGFYDVKGIRSIGGPLQTSPGMVLLVELLLLVPVLSLFNRRMNDMKASVRNQFSVARIGLPLVVLALILFQAASLFGLDVQFYADLFDPVRRLVLVILGISILLPPDIGPNEYGPDPRGAAPQYKQAPQPTVQTQPSQAFPDLNRLLSKKPAPASMARQGVTSMPAPIRHADRTHRPTPPPVVAAPEAVQRMHKMPEQGRVKPGWFS